ncbi:MAG: hypothetical protein ACKV2Q_35695 [Planctomycetaceae bacterium]
MVKFEGKWKYQSYRPNPGSVAADPKPATNEYPNPPNFIPWSPPGVVTVGECGTTGTLEFTGIPNKLDLKIQVTEGSLGGLSISAVMNLPGGRQFTNELQGWFVPAQLGQEVGKENPLVVRGSIVQTSADIAPKPQPIFTTGFFVLEPIQ